MAARFPALSQTPIPAKLCPTCKANLSGFRSWSSDGGSARDDQRAVCSVQSSIRNGCPTCRWIYAGLREEDALLRKAIDEGAVDFWQLRLHWSTSRRRGWYAVCAEPHKLTDADRHHMTLVIFAQLIAPTGFDFEATLGFKSFGSRLSFDIELGASRAQVDDGLRMADFTGSQESMNLAREWLKICTTDHADCQAMRLEDWRPLRLIHITSSFGGMRHLALHEASRNQYDHNVQYCTLSHRWASDHQLLLQTTNIEKFRDALDLKSLKACVRDAIEIVQRLDYEYIWIDTLCIVQDDLRERAEQVSQMDKVYNNAICNIAASDADTDDVGCFFDRDPKILQSLEICLALESLDHAKHIIRPCRHHINQARKECVLESRAWVFQERILAPRAIYCCKNQLYWECREMQASEARPYDPIPEFQDSDDSNSGWILPTLRSVFSRQAVQSAHIHDLAERRKVWYSLVTEYSQRSLTYPEDKLRALEGVSAAWTRMYHDTYMHGLWLSGLPIELLWSTDPSKASHRVSRQRSIAPSWSWASVSGSFISPREDEGELLAQLLGTAAATEIPATEINNSALASGTFTELRLCGYLSLQKWLRIEREGYDWPQYTLIRSDSNNSERRPAITKESAWDRVCFDDHKQHVAEIVNCFTINLTSPFVQGLLLQPVPGHRRRFSRIGYFQISSLDTCDALLEAEESVIELV